MYMVDSTGLFSFYVTHTHPPTNITDSHDELPTSLKVCESPPSRVDGECSILLSGQSSLLGALNFILT